jgi:hypothetical protein
MRPTAGAVSNWWEGPLETDFSKPPYGGKGALDLEVVSEVYDRAATSRIYGSPVYDREGNLRCRACGQPMGRSMSKYGLGVAACTDTGCRAGGFEFAEGSFHSNPGRVRG